VIEADRRPGILARMLGGMLQKVREIAELSYDEAAQRLGCDADWLVRVETGFAPPGPEETTRILVEYGAREAKAADMIIDMARRVAAPPEWLAPHTSRMTAANRDVLLVEAEATLAHLHGFRLIPDLVQTEEYYREIAPGVYPEIDPDQEWDLLSSRQAHQPAGVTRLLDVMIDESAFKLRFKRPQVLAGQLRHLLELSHSGHATVRVIPWEAPFWEQRGHNFAVLSFAGTTDRIGVAYLPVLGAELGPGDKIYEAWELIRDHAAADEAESRAILQRRLDALG
jgi:transcriptional regulator with XRE-family HTH domain